MDLTLICSTKAWMPGTEVGSAYGGRRVPSPTPLPHAKKEKGLRPGSWVTGMDAGIMSKNSKESL